MYLKIIKINTEKLYVKLFYSHHIILVFNFYLANNLRYSCKF